jgi:hypothetical protein
VAARIRVPIVWGCRGSLPLESRPTNVPSLRAAEHGNRGHDLRQDPHTASRVAGRGVVSHQSEARRERGWIFDTCRTYTALYVGSLVIGFVAVATAIALPRGSRVAAAG